MPAISRPSPPPHRHLIRAGEPMPPSPFPPHVPPGIPVPPAPDMPDVIPPAEDPPSPLPPEIEPPGDDEDDADIIEPPLPTPGVPPGRAEHPVMS